MQASHVFRNSVNRFATKSSSGAEKLGATTTRDDKHRNAHISDEADGENERPLTEDDKCIWQEKERPLCVLTFHPMVWSQRQESNGNLMFLRRRDECGEYVRVCACDFHAACVDVQWAVFGAVDAHQCEDCTGVCRLWTRPHVPPLESFSIYFPVVACAFVYESMPLQPITIHSRIFPHFQLNVTSAATLTFSFDSCVLRTDTCQRALRITIR